MPPGPLRRSIEDGARTFGSGPGEEGWWSKVRRRHDEWNDLVRQLRQKYSGKTPPAGAPSPVEGLIYTLTGSPDIKERMQKAIAGQLERDISTEVAQVMRNIFSQPAASEIAETLGALITEPVLTLFEKYAEQGRGDDVDPKEFARAFHGFMISLNISGGLADTILETVTGGQVEGAGRMLQSMYWSLGLGFLGWQTLAPLLSSGLQPGLERYYKKLYRPTRFSAADLRDLYALGEISLQQIQEAGRLEGWRDQDIEKWIRLAFRNLSQGDIFESLNQGFISQAEAVKRLRVLGYNPDDIPLLFKLNPAKPVAEARDFSVGNARKAFRDNLMSEAELRSILAGLKYAAREIEVIVALEKQAKAVEAKTLSLGQVRAAWEENILTDAEAVHWLSEGGFGPAEIEIVLDTWRAEIAPVFLKLNIGTLLGAYVEGILNRNQASLKLKEIGLAPENAALELDLAEARNPEAFGRPAPIPAKLLTPGVLSDLVAVGLLTPDIMQGRLLEMGFSEADARLLSEAARLRAEPAVRPMPQASVERAYLAGVITREQAFSRLRALDLARDVAEAILATLEKEQPEAFGGTPAERRRFLSPAILEDLVIGGLITVEEMRARLVELGFSEADARLLSERARQIAAPRARALPQSSIERAYLAGVMTREQARDAFTLIAFSAEQAELLLATIDKEQKDLLEQLPEERLRQLSPSVLEDLVIAGLLSPDEMFARLIELGFTDADAGLLTLRAAQLATPPVRVLGRGDIERAYLVAVLSRSQAKDKLLDLDFPPEEAEAILLTLERENPGIFNPDLRQATRLPSVNALVAAVQKTIISEDEYLARAQEIGYSVADSKMFLAIATRNERKGAKTLSPAQLVNAYGKGLIARGEALTRLSQAGYSDGDAILLLRMEQDFIVLTDTWDQLLLGNIEAIDAITELINAGYADADIYAAFAALPPATLANMGIDLPGLQAALSATPGGA